MKSSERCTIFFLPSSAALRLDSPSMCVVRPSSWTTWATFALMQLRWATPTGSESQRRPAAPPLRHSAATTACSGATPSRQRPSPAPLSNRPPPSPAALTTTMSSSGSDSGSSMGGDMVRAALRGCWLLLLLVAWRPAGRRRQEERRASSGLLLPSARSALPSARSALRLTAAFSPRPGRLRRRHARPVRRHRQHGGRRLRGRQGGHRRHCRGQALPDRLHLRIDDGRPRHGRVARGDRRVVLQVHQVRRRGGHRLHRGRRGAHRRRLAGGRLPDRGLQEVSGRRGRDGKAHRLAQARGPAREVHGVAAVLRPRLLRWRPRLLRRLRHSGGRPVRHRRLGLRDAHHRRRVPRCAGTHARHENLPGEHAVAADGGEGRSHPACG